MSELITQINRDIDQIEALLSDLSTKVMLDGSLSLLPTVQYEKIVKQFKKLDTSLFNHHKHSIDSSDRLEQLIDLLSDTADLDFAKRANVENTENYNHLDYIAIAINMMRERLEERFNELHQIKAVFDAFSLTYLLVDVQGTILYANQSLQRSYRIEPHTVVGMPIKAFLKLDAISQYPLDVYTSALHQVGYSPFAVADYEKDSTVLKITNETFHWQNQDLFIYKIEPLSMSVYRKANLDEQTVQAYRRLTETFLANLMAITEDKLDMAAKQSRLLLQIEQCLADRSSLKLVEQSVLQTIKSFKAG